jgi:hypothetical protein
MADPSPQPVAAAVDDDAPEPSLETVSVAQVAEAAPGRDRGVVDGVLGLDPIVEDHGRQPIGAVEVPVDEATEGVGSIVDDPKRRDLALPHRFPHETPHLRPGLR